MTIDLSGIFTDNFKFKHHSDEDESDGVTREYTVCYDGDIFSSGMGDYRITAKNPFVLTVTRTGSTTVSISGSTEIELEIPCDRCLSPVYVKIPVSPDTEVDFEDKETSDFADGYVIDIDKFLYPEIVMNLPMKVLCMEDCRGICRKCGKNLNEGSCDCDTSVPDPRMSVISDIFKQFNQK